jgi:hypothetical protein
MIGGEHITSVRHEWSSNNVVVTGYRGKDAMPRTYAEAYSGVGLCEFVVLGFIGTGEPLPYLHHGAILRAGVRDFPTLRAG